VELLLVASESPVRVRLADAIAELEEVHVETCEPNWADVERQLAVSHLDVMVVDVDGTRQQGLEIIRRTRSVEHAPVIVAVSGSKSLQYRSSCHDAGAMYFFNRVQEHDWLMDSLVSIRDQL
jgi:DNA-binding response OmpR family regulator